MVERLIFSIFENVNQGIYIFSLSLLSSVPQVHRGVRQLARVRVRALRLPDPGHLDPVLHLHDSGPYCSKQMDKMRRLKQTQNYNVISGSRSGTVPGHNEAHRVPQRHPGTKRNDGIRNPTTNISSKLTTLARSPYRKLSASGSRIFLDLAPSCHRKHFYICVLY